MTNGIQPNQPALGESSGAEDGYLKCRRAKKKAFVGMIQFGKRAGDL